MRSNHQLDLITIIFLSALKDKEPRNYFYLKYYIQCRSCAHSVFQYKCTGQEPSSYVIILTKNFYCRPCRNVPKENSFRYDDIYNNFSSITDHIYFIHLVKILQTFIQFTSNAFSWVMPLTNKSMSHLPLQIATCKPSWILKRRYVPSFGDLPVHSADSIMTFLCVWMMIIYLYFI